MDTNVKAVFEKRIQKTMASLEKNNMTAIYVKTAAEVPAAVEALLQKGESVAVGGSATLAECGVLKLLQSGNYRFLDRTIGNNEEEQLAAQRAVFSADAFLCSSNAITESGELYNVDGTSNRIAPLLFGPKSVIVVAGCNKLCKDIDKASVRVKSVAAPANTVRLGCATYCNSTGECAAFAKGNPGIASGCSTPARICCNYVISAYQRSKGRIKVILVGEELGY